MRFNLSPKPKRQRPDPEYTFEDVPDKQVDSRQIVCPRCRQKGGLFYIGTEFFPGETYDVYECFNYICPTRSNPEGLCGQRLYGHAMDPSVLWASPNGVWTIQVSYDWGYGKTPWFYLLQYGVAVNHRALYREDYAPWDEYEGFIPKYVKEAMLGILRDYGYKGKV